MQDASLLLVADFCWSNGVCRPDEGFCHVVSSSVMLWFCYLQCIDSPTNDNKLSTAARTGPTNHSQLHIAADACVSSTSSCHSAIRSVFWDFKRYDPLFTFWEFYWVQDVAMEYWSNGVRLAGCSAEFQQRTSHYSITPLLQYNNAS